MNEEKEGRDDSEGGEWREENMQEEKEDGIKGGGMRDEEMKNLERRRI